MARRTCTLRPTNQPSNEPPTVRRPPPTYASTPHPDSRKIEAGGTRKSEQQDIFPTTRMLNCGIAPLEKRLLEKESKVIRAEGVSGVRRQVAEGPPATFIHPRGNSVLVTSDPRLDGPGPG